MNERRAIISKCDRCGDYHGTKIVKPVPGLNILMWFFVCHKKQEPMYLYDKGVS